jgi:inosine/xanthosine triphosphatase
VGSTNATKLAAAEQGFAALPRPAGQALEVAAVAAASGVAAQPMGDAETRQGARSRALGALAGSPACDFAIGLEGGCSEEFGELVCFAWVCVVRAPRGGGAQAARESYARTASFALPRAVAELVRGGMELGAADDAVFSRVGSKHGEGAVGLLTRGAITRTSYYAHAVTCALVPFISAEHYE